MWGLWNSVGYMGDALLVVGIKERLTETGQGGQMVSGRGTA